MPENCHPPVLAVVRTEKPAAPVASWIFLAAARTSSHVVGGESGSRPAFVKSSRL